MGKNDPATGPRVTTPGPAATLDEGGALRAAAVLLALGPEIAARVFRYFDEPTVRRIAAGARSLRADDAPVDRALGEFVDAMEQVGGDRVAGEDILRAVAADTLGEDRARAAFGAGREKATHPRAPLDACDPEALAVLLAREHPQVVAAVLAGMSREKAQIALRALPEPARAPALARLSALESVPSDIMDLVTGALLQELRDSSASAAAPIDGPGRVAELLRHSSPRDRMDALRVIERDEPVAAGKVRMIFEGSGPSGSSSS